MDRPRRGTVHRRRTGAPDSQAPGPIDRLPGLASAVVRAWFERTFPQGPTPAQALAWPSIAAGRHTLLTSATGTGKTLAAFLAILDRLHREHQAGTLSPGLRAVYISPLRSLGYDIETNLNGPLAALAADLGLESSPITVGVRTGDTPAHHRRKLRDRPPHLLITTPESLALLLAQPAWSEVWRPIEYVILDEIHALVPTKRGADLAVTVERLAAASGRDPVRIGLSATCRPVEAVARFLVGPERSCQIHEAPRPPGDGPLCLEVESLLEPGEGPYRPLTYRRLVRRLRDEAGRNRTTVIFANTRAFAEKLTHDLRGDLGDESIAAHHSALDAARRRAVEAQLKSGELRAVVTSTSLELGVDIGTADVSVLVGLPGSAARCLQRVGRAGHRPGAPRRGLILAATAAELAGAAVTARAARTGQIEPIAPIDCPLDVLCQQLIGLACADEQATTEVHALLRRTAPFANLERTELEACLRFLAGELAAPAGAYEPEPGATPRSTAPRIWKEQGHFAVRNRRVMRWLWSNVGTITSEESVRVVTDSTALGTLEAAYAERLSPGDRFVLDGQTLQVQRLDGLILHAKPAGGEPDLPRWTSDRQSLSAQLARDLAAFRDEAAQRLNLDGPGAFRAWLLETYELEPDAAARLEGLLNAQQQQSQIPPPGGLLVEQWPDAQGLALAFHAPLARSACEALGRAVASRLGRRFGQNLNLAVADLGWTIRLPGQTEDVLGPGDIAPLLDPTDFPAAVLDGLDRGDLVARRFRHVASTAMMVLRRPEGGRTRVGGSLWVSQRLFPLVQAACPDHPLLREARREVLEDLLDAPGALAWLTNRPAVQFRRLETISPFTASWIEPQSAEALAFESPADALRRLHARLSGAPGPSS